MDSIHQTCSVIAEKLGIRGWDDVNEDARKLVQRHLITTPPLSPE
jgi:hypothetical protein